MDEAKVGTSSVVVSQHDNQPNHTIQHLEQDQQTIQVQQLIQGKSDQQTIQVQQIIQGKPDQQTIQVQQQHPELIHVNHQQQHLVLSGVTTVIQQLPVIQHHQHIQHQDIQHQDIQHQDIKPIEIREELQAIPLDVKPIPEQVYACEDLSVKTDESVGPIVNEKSANYISLLEDKSSVEHEKPKKEKEKETNCAGFEESLVLAVKDCFFEDEIRCILIKKTRNGKKVKYYSRSCTNYVELNKRVCDQCDRWFANLTGSLEFLGENGELGREFDFDSKGNLSNYLLEQKLDDHSEIPESFNGVVGHDVGVFDNIKHEFDDVATKVKKEIIDEQELNNGDADFEPLQDDPNDEDYVAPVKKPGRPKKKFKTKKMNEDGTVKTGTVKRKIPRDCIVEGGFICRFQGCGKVFPKRKGWLKHDRTHDGIKRTCEICGLAVAKLREHIKRVHEEDGGIGRNWERQRKYSEDRTEDDTYLCRWEDCRKLFENKKVYLKHVYLFHEGGNEKRKRKKICEICGTPIAANGMKQHIRSVHTHKDERNFTCEHCGKKFKHRTELTSHITHHTGEMNFSCSGCGKKFRRGGEARLCEKGHKGIFKHSCHICDYKTHKKNSLDRHVSSHMKSTPFTCPICGFKSGRKDNLKQHVEKRHATNGTTIVQLEAMYPEMYNTSEVVDDWRNDPQQQTIAQSRVLRIESSDHQGQTRVLTPSSPPHRVWNQSDQQGATSVRVLSPAQTPPPRSVIAPPLVLTEQNPERLVLTEQQRAILSATVQQRQEQNNDRLILPEEQRAILSAAEQQRIVITQQQRTVLTEQQRLVLTEQQRALLAEQHRAGFSPR